jgi:ribonucleotide reductase beta subunit family protein with ferritin-like domain
MQRKKWIKKIKSSDLTEEENKYYKSLTPEERVGIVQELREQYTKINNESTKRLRRILKTVKSK